MLLGYLEQPGEKISYREECAFDFGDPLPLVYNVFSGDMIFWKVRHEYGGIVGVMNLFREWWYMDLVVEVETSKLKEIVQQAFERHKEQYEEARLAYIEKAKRQIEELLGRLNGGEAAEIYGKNLSRPQYYGENYEKALRMFELHHGDTIKLNTKDYTRLIDDDWDWKREFAMSYTQNTGKRA